MVVVVMDECEVTGGICRTYSYVRRGKLQGTLWHVLTCLASSFTLLVLNGVEAQYEHASGCGQEVWEGA